MFERYDWLVIIGIVALVTIVYLWAGRSGKDVLARRRLKSSLDRKARDLMTHPVVVVHEEQTLGEAAKLMMDRDIRCLPVIGEAGELIGIVTEYDVTGRRAPVVGSRKAVLAGDRIRTRGLDAAYEEARDVPIGEVMSTRIVTAGEHDPVTEVATMMIERGVRHVPVLDEAGTLVGILTRHDLLRHLGTGLDAA